MFAGRRYGLRERLFSLVHGSAHSYFGAANKNVGDAFLVFWKLCDGELTGFSSFDDQASEEQRLKANQLIKCSIGKGRKVSPSQLADAAICSFLRCQLDLEEANREGELREYSLTAVRATTVRRRVRRQNGLRHARGLGRRGRHRLVAEDRCDLFVAARGDVGSARGGVEGLWDAPQLVPLAAELGLSLYYLP